MPKSDAEQAYERFQQAYTKRQGPQNLKSNWEDLMPAERLGWEAAAAFLEECFRQRLKQTDGYTPLPVCPTCGVIVSRAVGSYGEPFYCKPCACFWVPDLTQFRKPPETVWHQVQCKKFDTCCKPDGHTYDCLESL